MLRSLYTLALVCALATPAAAQTATVSGTITDQTGAAVPGATVTLDGPGGTRTAISGPRGEYSFTEPRERHLPGDRDALGLRPRHARRGGRRRERRGAGDHAWRSPASATPSSSAPRSPRRALIDAPATMSVVTSEMLASTPAQNYGDLLRSRAGRERDPAVGARRQPDQPAGHVDAHQLAARAARRPLDLPRLLRPRAVGLPARRTCPTSSRSRWCAARRRRSGAPTRSPASSTSSPSRRARRRARPSR